MKILLIVHSVAWKGGGAFFHALHIAKGLVKKGNLVSIMCTSSHSYFKIRKKKLDGVEIIQFPDLLFGQARNGWDLYNTIWRIFYLLKNKFDIVHLLDTRPVVIFPGLFAKYFGKSKLVIEWLDWFGKGGTATERTKVIRFFMEPIESFFEEKFRKYADGSIGLGEPLSKRIMEYASDVPLITITHGCDTNALKMLDMKSSRIELNLEHEAFYIGYTGRMRKDVIIRLVSLVKLLKEKLSNKNVYCILIGNSAYNVDNFLDKEIENNFIRTGWIEYAKVNKYMSSCNLLLLPFDSNSVARNGIWPSKINDYLSVGRPIVTTKLEVLKDLFLENEIGFMTKDNVQELAKYCLKLLLDDELSNKLGQNARRLAESTLNWEYVVNNIEKFYNSIL